jgi:hypothetical protein
MFFPLYKQIVAKNPNILSQLSNDIKLIVILKFLNDHKLFD